MFRLTGNVIETDTVGTGRINIEHATILLGNKFLVEYFVDNQGAGADQQRTPERQPGVAQHTAQSALVGKTQ